MPKYTTAQAFLDAPHKNITLLGMSGVGKTYLSHNLVQNGNWFHYSGDYRIGTRYLAEPILDNIKYQLMPLEPLGNLLRSDAIYIAANISIGNLAVVTDFLGKPGNPELGGLSLPELKRRHALHHVAEIAAMRDVPDFINKAYNIYRYQHFINDAGGSLCDLCDEATFALLAGHTTIIYIQSNEQDETTLKQRANDNPKPLYYREEYIDFFMQQYLNEQDLNWVACVHPDEFTRWVFPHLLARRAPTYEQIADTYGYTVLSSAISQVRDEADLFALVAEAIDTRTQGQVCQ